MAKFTIEREIEGKKQNIEIQLDDVLGFIQKSSGYDNLEIYEAAKDKGDIEGECDCYLDNEKVDANYIVLETMVDEMKMEFLASVFEKYTLEQLEERLK